MNFYADPTLSTPLPPPRSLRTLTVRNVQYKYFITTALFSLSSVLKTSRTRTAAERLNKYKKTPAESVNG